jgi:hypothetical protein
MIIDNAFRRHAAGLFGSDEESVSPFTHEECVRGGRAGGELVRDRYGRAYYQKLGKRSAKKRAARFVRIPIVVFPGEHREDTARRYGVHVRTLQVWLQREVSRG